MIPRIAIQLVLCIFLLSVQTLFATDKKLLVALNDLSPQGTLDVGTAQAISDRLRNELFNTGAFSVVERSQMQEILKEQGFQQSGACSTDACVVEMGQLLGVQLIIVGSIAKVGATFTINARMIDVSTGKIVQTATSDCRRCEIDDVLLKSAVDIANKMASNTAFSKSTSTNISSLPPDSTSRQPKPASSGEPWKWLFGASFGYGAQDGYHLGLGATIGAIAPSHLYFALDFKYFFGSTLTSYQFFYPIYIPIYINYKSISIGGEFGYSIKMAQAFYIRPYIRPALFSMGTEGDFAISPGLYFDMLPVKHFMISIDNSYNLVFANSNSDWQLKALVPNMNAYCIFLKLSYIVF